MRFYSQIVFTFILFLGFRLPVPAQEKSDPPKDASAEVYSVGGDVKPPKVTHYVEPDPSSQETYVEGVVKLSAIINLDGAPAALQVIKGLNDEEDKLALEALKQWRFSPGTKSGHPVRVKITVEISFHLL